MDSVRVLIQGTTLNVKEFGAVGNGKMDDTASFIRCYESARNAKLVTDELIAVKIPEGKYYISSTIELPVYVKTIVEGTVVIISEVKDGATLHFTSGSVDIDTTGLRYISNSSMVDGDVIAGGNLILQRANNYDDINSDCDSIGILIGDDVADNNKIPVARCSFNNITISGFKKALAIRPVNTYLLTFNKIHTENDYYGIYIGGEAQVNSGENITFNNCIFSHHYHAVCNEFEYICGLNFNNCSFDFNANHVLQNIHGNVLYNFNGCHFEGVGYTDEKQIKANVNTIGFGSIFHRNSDNKYTRSLAVFTGCYFHLATFTPCDYIFTAKETSRPYSVIKIKNYGISWNYDNLRFSNRFLADKNTEIELSAPEHAIDYTPYNGSDNDIIGKFNHISNELLVNYTDDQETIKKLGYEISANTWSSTPVYVSVLTTNKVFDKSLMIEQNSFNTNCGLTRIIENITKNYISTVSYFQVSNIVLQDNTVDGYKVAPQIRYRFYDKNDNLLKEHLIPCDDYTYVNGEWICTSTIAKVPTGACKCMVLANMILKNDDAYLNFKGSVIFGGHILEQMD